VDKGNMVHSSDTNPHAGADQLQPISVIFTLPEDQLQSVSQHMKSSTLQVEALQPRRPDQAGDGQASDD